MTWIKETAVNTTLAKQIANWVVIYSPLQMASDMIENYEGASAFQFFGILMRTVTAVNGTRADQESCSCGAESER